MTEAKPKKNKKLVRRAVGRRLKPILAVMLALFALLAVNSFYLVSITILEAITGEVYQNYFYQVSFLVHLVLGIAIVLPVLAFGIGHARNTYNRPNRRAVRAGWALLTTALILLVSGFLLLRLESFEVRDPRVRNVAYWAHVAAPVLCIWIYVLHRLAGPRIRWKVGTTWMGIAAGFALVMALLHSQDPKRWGVEGPESAAEYFFPSLARTSDGNFIEADRLMNDQYCIECHADIHDDWSKSVHKFSSFNNPAYLFSVRGTREAAIERHGELRASRFCAGCHDPVPFFSGAFDDPNYDDENDPTADAGITCTVCHSITHVNSPKGNSDYTIEAPSHYPFTFSDNSVLRWVNRQLVKAKPAFHKKTFLKPLHTTPEFCGTCHKVHLPEELNDYKWLRGQNHYDPYLLSGVSGHGVTSFYYPPKAKENCNVCHMELKVSEDFGAQIRDDSGELKVHDHLFPSANTAVPYLVGMEDADEVIKRHEDFTVGSLRVDLFGVRKEGRIDGELIAPLRPEVPELVPGESYLFETVLRTLTLGHLFTQGTVDSNEIWVDVVVTAGDRVIGRSGGMDHEKRVDPWSYFVNAYVLDREGNRIERRNAEDIFVALYNHQIPPGAGDVIHYRLDLPADLDVPVTVKASLKYRKFDTTYVQHFRGPGENDLHVMTIASDEITFPVRSAAAVEPQEAPDIPLWQRWNDYGIGLLRKAGTTMTAGELRQAEHAFSQVEEIGRPDGPLNLARVYVREGRLEEAVEALARAASHETPAPPWTVAWFSGLVDRQNGFLDEAIAAFEGILTMDTEETRERGFDFSLDYRVSNELGMTLFERARQERGDARAEAREAFLRRSQAAFDHTLGIDPENLSAHYNLALVLEELGHKEQAAEHRRLHEKYRPDDNAKDFAVAAARRKDPAANHAAEAVVVYDLMRPGAFELPEYEGTR